MPSRPQSKLIKNSKRSCLTSAGTEEDELLSQNSKGKLKDLKAKKKQELIFAEYATPNTYEMAMKAKAIKEDAATLS